MNSLADLWVRSGKNPGRLFQGSIEVIAAELKAWIERRKVHNDINMAASWDMFRNADSLQQIANQPGEIQRAQAPQIMDQVAGITATQINALDHTRVSHLLIVWSFGR